VSDSTPVTKMAQEEWFESLNEELYFTLISHTANVSNYWSRGYSSPVVGTNWNLPRRAQASNKSVCYYRLYDITVVDFPTIRFRISVYMGSIIIT